MGRNMIKSEKYIPTPKIVKIKSVWEWFLSRIPEWYGIAWQNYGNELWAQQSVFAVRLKVWVLSYTSSAPWRLIRLGVCQGWSESSLGTQAILFCHVHAHIWIWKQKVGLTYILYEHIVWAPSSEFVSSSIPSSQILTAHAQPFSGPGIWLSVWRFLLTHCLYERVAKVLARLRGCAGSPEPSLLA